MEWLSGDGFRPSRQKKFLLKVLNLDVKMHIILNIALWKNINHITIMIAPFTLFNVFYYLLEVAGVFIFKRSLVCICVLKKYVGYDFDHGRISSRYTSTVC